MSVLCFQEVLAVVVLVSLQIFRGNSQVIGDALLILLLPGGGGCCYRPARPFWHMELLHNHMFFYSFGK
jgi:hypothetical protein